ncbi:hypothetical protein TNCV_4888301 [Trichonephila clavipes]|nr:hypothetical protein TNCV_4888301 [Trichonephila clavipes]
MPSRAAVSLYSILNATGVHRLSFHSNLLSALLQFSWGMLNGAPSPTGALISYLIMVRLELIICPSPFQPGISSHAFSIQGRALFFFSIQCRAPLSSPVALKL